MSEENENVFSNWYHALLNSKIDKNRQSVVIKDYKIALFRPNVRTYIFCLEM